MDYSERRRRLLAELERLKLDAILVTHLPNVRYLTGFTGSAAALLIENKAQAKPVFVTDGRYSAQAREQVKGVSIALGRPGVLGGCSGRSPSAIRGGWASRPTT